MQNIQKLFSKLTLITGIEDIGYERIEDNTLKPVVKSVVGKISEADWIRKHSENKVNISTDHVIKTIVDTKKPVYIRDCSTNGTKHLELFSVYSDYLYPVISSGKVGGIIVMASIGEKKELSEETLAKCESLIRKYIG